MPELIARADPLALVDHTLASLGFAIRIENAVCHWAAWLVDARCGTIARTLSGAPAELTADQARLLIYTQLAIELHGGAAIGSAEPRALFH